MLDACAVRSVHSHITISESQQLCPDAAQETLVVLTGAKGLPGWT